MKGKERVLRLSLDAKATVNVGEFSRNGKSRVVVKGFDHDFQPDETITPYGILLPDYDCTYLYFTKGRVTSDFMVDCLEDCWRQLKVDFPHVDTLLLYQDNGPENHSRRTQFMARITQLVDQMHLTIQLAYYPPYHSKYKPIERVWGRLEQHWNGSLLDEVDTVLNFAQTMRWNGQSPVVKLVEAVYETGKKLSQQAMSLLEQRFEREKGLEKWFVKIRPLASYSS